MKLLLQLQFGRAIRAADHVLLQFVTGVIRQLAINLKHDIFSYPFTFHRCTFIVHEPCGIAAWAAPLRTYLHLISAKAPRNFCVARNKVFLAVSSVVCKISPTV